MTKDEIEWIIRILESKKKKCGLNHSSEDIVKAVAYNYGIENSVEVLEDIKNGRITKED